MGGALPLLRSRAQAITIYGDGFQVRDVLHVYDLLDAMQAAQHASSTTAGEIYNIGGGPQRTVSVLDALRRIHELTGIAPILQTRDVRPGDQPLYISNIGKLQNHTGWAPTRSLGETLESIMNFWQQNRDLLTRHRAAELSHATEAVLASQGTR